MNETLKIECGPADTEGRRIVLASCGAAEHRDRFNTDDAFRRARFAEAALGRFGWAITQELLHEIDTKLVGEADAEDARHVAGSSKAAQQVCLADVEPADVAWLWPGRIALGKVTLLAGDPGLGKSMVTLDIAARVSRGAPWPEEVAAQSLRDRRAIREGESGRGGDSTSPNLFTSSPPLPVSPSPTLLSMPSEACPRRPASVVLLSAEDDLADTIRPRLEAHGADCSRIVAIQAIGGRDEAGQYQRAFDLGRDLEQLTATIDTLENCRLIIIDPISAYLGKTGENANAEVRALLGPLALLAAERQLAILVVTHLRKEEGAAMYRAMGSLAFMAAARAAWIIGKDPADSRRRLMLPVKNNLAADVGGLAYAIEPLGPEGRAVVCWSAAAVSCDLGTALREPARRRGPSGDERLAVGNWLREFLEPGPQPVADVRAHALALGYSNTTLRRAFRELGGNAHRDDQGRWLWSLIGEA